MTRHHIRPKAMGGDDSISNIFYLCRPCHDSVHYFFGPGNRYTGPIVYREFYKTILALSQSNKWKRYWLRAQERTESSNLQDNKIKEVKDDKNLERSTP